MKIVRVGYNYRHSPDFCIDRPHGSGDYLLLIIKSEAFLVLCGERMIVPPNSAIIFKKGTPQHYGAVCGKYINDWIHFDIEESEERVIAELSVPFDTVIPLCEATELSAFIKNIVIERYSQNMHREATMQRYFDLLLLKLSENINHQNPEQEHPYYNKFYMLRNEIQLEPQADWSIDGICKRMMLSRSYVQHLYKLFFGTSIMTDVQSSRMEHAKYLLSATNMTVTGISESCGYENDVHFMRVFKKVTGITPSEFRNRYQISSKVVGKMKAK